MRKHFRVCGALLLTICLLAALAACGTQAYGDIVENLVQGNLDELYLGKYDEGYLKLVDITEAEAEEAYITGLETEASVFAYYFDIEYMTEEIESKIVDLYKEIYSHSKYTVGEATELDDNTFAVKVTVEPIDIFQLVTDSYDEFSAEFWAKYADTDFNTISEEDYQAFDADWANMIIELCYEKMPELGYMEEKSIVIQVERDSDDVWSISQDDFYNFDEAVIYYP